MREVGVSQITQAQLAVPVGRGRGISLNAEVAGSQ